jgi:DNA-binding GntR family transcriptional regulator
MSQPIERAGHSFADQAEDALRNQILTGSRAPGDRLNEVEIAGDLGVSRGPVREAMQRLARDGLVQMLPHRGTFVRSLEPGEITRLYEVRISLECTAARLAAQSRTDSDIERLQALLESSTAEVNRTGDPHYPTHLDLHELVAVVSGNDRLHRLIVQINQELKLVRAVSGFRPERAPLALVEHSDVVAAIVNSDGPRADELMRSHLLQSLDNTLRLAGAKLDEISPATPLDAKPAKPKARPREA